MLLSLLACAAGDGGLDSEPSTTCRPDRAPAPQLVDVAADLGLQGPLARNMGISVEDMDGDGDPDVLRADGGHGVRWFDNDAGRFTPRPFTTSPRTVSAVLPVDWDGDGDLDLHLSCGSMGEGCADALLRNEGGDFVHDGSLPSTDHVHFSGAWADFDGDGDLDLFQPCMVPPPAEGLCVDHLYRNEDGAMVDAADEVGLHLPGPSIRGLWLDVNADGWQDLFVVSLTSDNRLFINDGGLFDEVELNVTTPDQGFSGAIWDLNRDGHIDLVVSGRTDPDTVARHAVLLGDGAGGFIDVADETGINDGDGILTMGFSIGDINHDGQAEVFFGNGSPDAGAVNLWGSLEMHDGQLTWVDRTEQIDVPPDGLGGYPYRSHGSVLADLDLDGVPELLIGNGGGEALEPHRVFRNVAPVGAAVTVELTGRAPNTRAVGARVRVSDDDWLLERQVLPDVGFNGHVGMPWTFGTGECQGPYTVTVWWPDGTRTETSARAGDRLVLEQPG